MHLNLDRDGFRADSSPHVLAGGIFNIRGSDKGITPRRNRAESRPRKPRVEDRSVCRNRSNAVTPCEEGCGGVLGRHSLKVTAPKLGGMSAAPVLDVSVDVADLTRALIDVPSESGNEKAIADVIEATLAACAHLDIIRDGDAVVARTTRGCSTRVIIAGHLDTVPINRNVPAQTRGEGVALELWGRGAVDMKAGCAVALKLAAELSEPAVDVTWVFYDHEEVEAELNGLGRVIRNHPDLLRADFAILGEPTSARVEGGCNGTLRVEVHTTGTRAHSARWWAGSNAIHALGPILDALRAYEPASIEVDGLVYREGLNAVGIGGGVATNIIPDAAHVTVNYRFAPSRTEAEAEANVREIFAGFDVRVVDSAPGARPGLDHPAVRAFVARVGGEAQPKFGWTDVARFSAMGIPAINYGPGDPALAHADDERVVVQQIRECESVLRTWLTGSAR